MLKLVKSSISACFVRKNIIITDPMRVRLKHSIRQLRSLAHFRPHEKKIGNLIPKIRKVKKAKLIKVEGEFV